MPARLRQLVREGGGAQEVPHRDPAAAGLVLVRRPDAAQRRPDLPAPPLLLGQGLEAPVVRQDEVRAVRDDEVVADLDAERLELPGLPLEGDRVHHDAVADHAEDPRVQDPGGDEVQHELLPRDDHGVAGVVAAVVARHHLDPRRQQVHDLPLAFVAPLGAGDHDVGHVPRVRVWRSRSGYSSAGSGRAAESTARARPRTCSCTGPRAPAGRRRGAGRAGTGRSASRRCDRCTARRRRCRGTGSGRGSCSRRRSGCTRPAAWRGGARRPAAGGSTGRTAASSPCSCNVMSVQSAMQALSRATRKSHSSRRGPGRQGRRGARLARPVP